MAASYGGSNDALAVWYQSPSTVSISHRQRKTKNHKEFFRIRCFRRRARESCTDYSQRRGIRAGVY